jgi:hypothetical protein
MFNKEKGHGPPSMVHGQKGKYRIESITTHTCMLTILTIDRGFVLILKQRKKTMVRGRWSMVKKRNIVSNQ